MPLAFDSLPALLAHGFDTLIDVRSPAEHAEDHIPGALNLPALSNDERARVGTIYKQIGAFEARRIGAALVARNVAAHLEGPLADKSGPWRPLVYCWRGGQRSGSVATILTQVGWRAETITGGYQAFRRLVHAALYGAPLDHRVILLDGNTGTAKTEVLQRLARHGIQVIDLEGLARHRGSLLGARRDGQPAQKAFETRIAAAIAGLDPDRAVVIEAESSRIGRLIVPPALWAAMCRAGRIELTAPVPARASYLAQGYGDVASDRAWLLARLDALRTLRGHAVVDRWQALVAAGEDAALAEALITQHYDPAYDCARRTHDRPVLARIGATLLDRAGIDALTADVARIVTQA
ncbi:MAG: tRNA 2-selenouridine(34) synthase MnmH [Rubellimicrobium sp.]|nr:tRNA 2-selenouridine(34) synthase MnmH [Rubellimicrobium sp.]